MPGRRPSLSWRHGQIANGRGIACVAYEGDNGYVALIAEVEVDPAVRSRSGQAFCGGPGLRSDFKPGRSAQSNRGWRTAGYESCSQRRGDVG